MRTRIFLLVAFAVAAVAAAPAHAQPADVSASTRVEADGSRTLVHETIVAASPEQVWQAIATPEGWTSWAVPVAWTPTGEPDVIETSYDPKEKEGGAGTIRQRLLARIPNRMLAVRTIKAPAGFPHWEAYAQVSSVFELEPVAPGRTRVRLTGVGYPATPAGEAVLRFFERGNAASLEWLGRRFVEGPADWAKRLAPQK